MKKGNKYGTHRVIEPKGVLPQPANKLDNNMDEIYDNEILIRPVLLRFTSRQRAIKRRLRRLCWIS